MIGREATFNMRHLLAFLFLTASAYAAATTWVSDGSDTDIINKNASAASGDTITIPSGSFNWDEQVTIKAGVSLIGAGTTALGGGDVTTIVDNFASGSPLLDFSGTRLSGITFSPGTGPAKVNNGHIVMRGTRIDHCTFNNLGSRYLTVTSKPGVLDHCIFNCYNRAGGIMFRNGTGTTGDAEWAAATAFGTDDYFYVEDNLFYNNSTGEQYDCALTDGDTGGKFVMRFNTMYGVQPTSMHGTGHGVENRGVRSCETYGNLVTKGADPASYAGVNILTGTALVWGNSWDQAFRRIYVFGYSRYNDTTYAQNPHPAGYGYGGAPVGVGVVNTTETVLTRVSGTSFNSAWVGRTIIITTATDTYARRVIQSVDSADQITLAANTGSQGALGTLSGKTFNVGSPWDGNTDALGYPMLDQPGRGQGDLLGGGFPNRLISGGPRNGTAVWPEQALEPIYIWNNAGTFEAGDNGTVYDNVSNGLIVANRDYYPSASGIQTNATTPFDGTTGTGWGTLANRPTTCTTGVAYWATDQGSWNQSTSNAYGVQQNGADGQLFVCTSTNTWTLYYEPYTYPHLLNVNEETAATPRHTPPNARGTLGRRR